MTTPALIMLEVLDTAIKQEDEVGLILIAKEKQSVFIYMIIHGENLWSLETHTHTHMHACMHAHPLRTNKRGEHYGSIHNKINRERVSFSTQLGKN